jgi:hypothetical protein
VLLSTGFLKFFKKFFSGEGPLQDESLYRVPQGMSFLGEWQDFLHLRML